MADSLINKAKKKRGAIRASITRIITKIQNALENFNTDSSDKLEELLEHLNEKSYEIKAVDTEIESLVEEKELDAELLSAEEYRDKITTWRFRATKKLRSLTSEQKQEISHPEHSTSNEVGTIQETKEKVNIKLPKLSIIKYFGDHSEWLSFWSSFESAIHKNDSLDPVDKFNYLKAYLGGNALKSIEGLAMTSEHYENAIEILQERFGNKEALINAHMSNLLNISPLRNSDDTKSFRNMYDRIQTQIRSLECLGVSTDSYGNLLCPILMKMLPRDIILDFNKEYTDLKYTLKEIMNFLLRQLNSRERTFSDCEIVSSPSRRLPAERLQQERSPIEKTEKQLQQLIYSLAMQMKSHLVHFVMNHPIEVQLQALIVSVVGKGIKSYSMRAICDTASSNSYISQYAAGKLEPERVRKERIKHGLFGGTVVSENHNRYKLKLVNPDKEFSCEIEVLDEKQICASIPKIKNAVWIKQLENKGIYINDVGGKRNLCLYDKDPEEIHLLHGADVLGNWFTGRIERLSENNMIAIETKLGWTLMGKMYNEKDNTEKSLSVLSLSMHVSDSKLEDLWRLDTLGISAREENVTKSMLEEETRKHFVSTLKRDENGRYEVALPWTVDSSLLQSNRLIAEKSLVKTEKKLISTDKREDYQKIFDFWESEDIIEAVNDKKELGVHYLPHRQVIKESSETTKIRPVFYASAHSRSNPSLNDCLAKGPNLMEIIPTILNRFRKYRIGVSSDIEKAFLQISVREEDRDFLRFLWYDDEHNLKIFRHRCVVFGLTTSPFLLASTLDYHLSNVPESCRETAEMLKTSFYIDNSLVSLNYVTQTEKFIQESKSILSSGHFNLRCWKSNVGNSMIEEVKGESKEIPVLGLIWNLEDDCLTCKVENTCNLKDPITKRKVLSVAQKVFDPIGFTAPVTLVPKLILQETWIQKIKWDEELPIILQKKFQIWMKQLHLLSEIKIPRWINIDQENEDRVTLHVFSDASKSAYAACFYVRSETTSGPKVQLVNARSRVAPIKEMTIPRLELLSCLIGVRLAETVKADLQMFNSIYYWTDSTTALGWIRRDQAWGTFVHNRVQEIRSLTDMSDWRHVPGSLNIADLPSRGCSFEQLQKSKWWEGPPWLYLPETEWPRSEEQPDEELLNKEKRKTIVTLMDREDKSDWYFRHFSSFKKIVRMIAWMFRFYGNTRNLGKNGSPNLSVLEREKAEKTLYRLIQEDSFTGITDPSIRTLRPIKTEEGILRAKSNVAQRDDKEDFRYPIILPSNHPVVHRLIFEKHVEMQHAGITILMAQLRETLWILKSRKTIRNVIRKCVKCQKFDRPKLEVEPGIPPEDRVREAAVFEVTGVDLAGPLYLKDGSKCWIVLFTCAIYRAVHLELVTSLSTEAFMQSFRRFISRRGRPYIVYSDNGSNFVKTRSALSRNDWNAIAAEAADQKIHWKLNPPSAAWWGGWWERLVRMVKQLLRRSLGRASLNYEELSTILCDCENILNSRPITYVSEDVKDPQPLTPLMFLQELPSSGVPDLDEVDSKELGRRARYRQRLRRDVRNRFRKEYLGQLRQFALKKRKSDPVKIGDIVLLEDMTRKRINWPLAKVVEIFPGKDDIVRLAKVKTENGMLLRPVQRLYPLEINSPTTTGAQEPAAANQDLLSSYHRQNSRWESVAKATSTSCEL
ncbi:uncharacterized protein LOC129231039 [Uloborus diversus]|uniref:uncharacterized protein LOC129231039 n=1 Tax=Uloborus diversus TaxID=327109 RepID=UPI0024090385|nr:uncharacterized protein LOC129231039 [Uloborus diversus]